MKRREVLAELTDLRFYKQAKVRRTKARASLNMPGYRAALRPLCFIFMHVFRSAAGVSTAAEKASRFCVSSSNFYYVLT